MRIALFVTCLAEAFAPEIAEAAARLVRHTAGPGGTVTLLGDGCCGQPAWNAGYPAEARALARRLIPRLRGFDLVVVPSGSCAAMLMRYYPHLFPVGDPLHAEAEALAARTRELSQHLAAAGFSIPDRAPEASGDDAQPRAMQIDPGDGEPRPMVAAFHPSCHSLRGAFVGDSGQRCLAAAGCSIAQHASADECCGFGGLFAIKESALSSAMADHKLDALTASGASTVVAGELGCLLHLEGRARRRGLRLRFRHLAEVLAERLPAENRSMRAEGGL